MTLAPPPEIAPDGRFGPYGGRYVPETLIGALEDLTVLYDSVRGDESFWSEYHELLRDVVWVVRSFRPQVIVSIFSGTPADGHGQHQASGVIAREAFAELDAAKKGST